MNFQRGFQRGGEELEKIPSVGEVWIFSGTTHCIIMVAISQGNRIPFSDDNNEKPLTHQINVLFQQPNQFTSAKMP